MSWYINNILWSILVQKKVSMFFVLNKGVLVQLGTQKIRKLNLQSARLDPIAFKEYYIRLSTQARKVRGAFLLWTRYLPIQAKSLPPSNSISVWWTNLYLTPLKKKKRPFSCPLFSLFLFFPPLLESPTRHNNGENSSHIKMLLEAFSRSAPNFINENYTW